MVARLSGYAEQGRFFNPYRILRECRVNQGIRGTSGHGKRGVVALFLRTQTQTVVRHRATDRIYEERRAENQQDQTRHLSCRISGGTSTAIYEGRRDKSTSPSPGAIPDQIQGEFGPGAVLSSPHFHVGRYQVGSACEGVIVHVNIYHRL